MSLKGIQFKLNGTKAFPTKNIDVLLSTPLQAANSSNANASTKLLKKYTKYDILACRVNQSLHGREGCWCFIFPKHSYGKVFQEQWIVYCYDTYRASGKIIFESEDTVTFSCQSVVGWNYNSLYLEKVLGIRLTE